jgi:hypothetical protein
MYVPTSSTSKAEHIEKTKKATVLRIRYFYSGFKIFPSRIPDPRSKRAPDPGSQICIFSIPDPGVKKNWITDPQHWKTAENKRLNALGKRKNCEAVPDVGREISDHVDISNDEVVLKEEVAQEVPLLVRVTVRLITQQAAHFLT